MGSSGANWWFLWKKNFLEPFSDWMVSEGVRSLWIENVDFGLIDIDQITILLVSFDQIFDSQLFVSHYRLKGEGGLWKSWSLLEVTRKGHSRISDTWSPRKWLLWSFMLKVGKSVFILHLVRNQCFQTPNWKSHVRHLNCLSLRLETSKPMNTCWQNEPVLANATIQWYMSSLDYLDMNLIYYLISKYSDMCHAILVLKNLISLFLYGVLSDLKYQFTVQQVPSPSCSSLFRSLLHAWLPASSKYSLRTKNSIRMHFEPPITCATVAQRGSPEEAYSPLADDGSAYKHPPHEDNEYIIYVSGRKIFLWILLNQKKKKKKKTIVKEAEKVNGHGNRNDRGRHSRAFICTRRTHSALVLVHQKWYI